MRRTIECGPSRSGLTEEQIREVTARAFRALRPPAQCRPATVEEVWRAIPAEKRNAARLSFEAIALVLDALHDIDTAKPIGDKSK